MEGANTAVASVMDHLMLAANGRDFAYRQQSKSFQLFNRPEGQINKRASSQIGGDTKDPKKLKQDNKRTDLTDAKKEELKKKGFLVQKGRALKNCPIKFKCLGNKVLCSRHISKDHVCQFTKRGCNFARINSTSEITDAAEATKFNQWVRDTDRVELATEPSTTAGQ